MPTSEQAVRGGKLLAIFGLVRLLMTYAPSFAPLVLIAGIYGLRQWPELRQRLQV
jgi:hypothetical protein